METQSNVLMLQNNLNSTLQLLKRNKMKYITTILTAIFLFAVHTTSIAQATKKVETVTFWVNSACGRCEETIEKAMDTKGVITADYNLENQMLTVTYKTQKVTESKLHQLINEVGYDTDKSICTDEQYARVHHCCKYRELEKH